MQTTEEGLRQLPKPPSADALTEILHLLADFSRDLSVCLEGTPDADGLMQQVRPHYLTFKRAIRATAPDFRATLQSTFYGDDDNDDNETRSTFDFLENEEDAAMSRLTNRRAVYIDEVMKRAAQSVTSYLFPSYPC